MNQVTQQHFFFNDNRLFFSVSSFSKLLGVRLEDALNATLGCIHKVDTDNRIDHVLMLGCSVPAYVDSVAFEAVIESFIEDGIKYDIDNRLEIYQVLQKEFPVLKGAAAKSSLDGLLASDVFAA